LSLLKIDNLRKDFNLDGMNIRALNGIYLEVEAGELVVIVGRSGSGKTTLLRILAGLETKTSGIIEFQGKQMDENNMLPVGMVFQEPRLLPWLSVEKNILFPFLAKGGYAANRETSARLLEMLGLKNYANALPSQLSGGMAQRVALGRALSGDPEIVLLDEPLGSLDYFTRAALQNELLRLYLSGGKTFIMVTHDVVEALLLATRVLVLKNGEIVHTLDVGLRYPRLRGDVELQAMAAEVLSAVGDD